MATEHGGNRRLAARICGMPPQAILDFSSNINPLGPPPGLVDYLARFLEEVAYYPDPEYGELKDALKAYLMTSSPVVLGNGAAELIYSLPLVLRPRRVLVVEPAFAEYAAAARAAGAEVKSLDLRPEDFFSLTAGELERHLAGVEMCYLGHPNNPTGNLLLEPEAIAAVAARHPRCLFVVDESFLDFLPQARPALSLAPLVAEYPNLCVLYSLTKFFALPGLRLGCAVIDHKMAARLEECSPPWRINSLAARAGLYVLEQSGYASYTRYLVAEEREHLARGLKELSLEPFPASANFLLVSLKKAGLTGATLQAKLGSKGILIRRCTSFAGLDDSYVRLAVRLPWENRYLLRNLREPEDGNG